MAGGTNKRGKRGAMAERLARGRGEEPSVDLPPEVKHCRSLDELSALPVRGG